MAKKNIQQKQQEGQTEAEEQKVKKGVSPSDNMLFHKENYMLMGIGLVLILLGFALMAGGKSADPNVFAADELYSFRRITLAPILVLIGFIVEGYAILKKPNNA